MISAALSKFHTVKDPGQARFRFIATAVKVDPPAVTKGDGVPGGVQLPTKDGPPPTKPAQNPPPQNPPAQGPPPNNGDQKVGDTKGSTTTAPTVVPTVVTTQPQVQPQTAVPGTVTNTFSSEDIKQVMSDVATGAHVTITPDDTIKEQNVTVEFNNDPIDDVVDKLAIMAGAFSKEISPGFYIISKATPDSALYSRFVETKIYTVKNRTAAAIQAVMSPSYKNYISFDPKTNTIGIAAPHALLEKILSDVMQADRVGRQVLVEALVTEITHEDQLNTGFSWNTSHFAESPSLGISYAQASAADMVNIQAAITNHKMTLRANPHLITTAGVESTVQVGQDVYYSLLSGSTIYPTSQIQLIHTGTTLKFTAFVGDDGWISMQLDPTVSDSVIQVNGNPTSNIRTASTFMRVRSGQTIVIAGLVQDTNSRQIIRVPILGYIPLIGEIFTQRNYDKKKVETIFMITPKLIAEAPAATAPTGQ